MKIKVVCRKKIVYKNSTSPLFLRFTRQRQSKFISLGLSIRAEHWDDKNQMLAPECPKRKALQLHIDTQLTDYQKQIERLQALDLEVTFEALFGNTVKGKRRTIEEYFGLQIDQLKASGRINTATKYRFCLSSLRKYRSMNLPFEQIDPTFLREFESHQRIGGSKENSIATKMSVLKAVYNKAIADKVFIPKENPFAQHKIGNLWTATRKRSITKEEVHRLIELELPTARSPYLAFARDIFLFSYFTAGINFKDMATLRFCNIANGRIYYARHKTGKAINCPLAPIAQEIIQKYAAEDHSQQDYIFPILDRALHQTEQQIFNRIHKVLQNINRQLRRLGDLMGLNISLTTYVARHTFATVLKRSGVNIAIISESLGHSDLSTTQIYLDSFENSQIDEAMQNLL